MNAPNSSPRPNTLRNGPDEHGQFGQFGGRYVSETLMPLILELEREYRAAQADPAFQAELDDLMRHYGSILAEQMIETSETAAKNTA